MPPEMGLSGPRVTGCAGASPSDFTAGPPSEAPGPATATGRLGPGAAPLSREASKTGEALLVCLAAGCGAGPPVGVGDGLGCAGEFGCVFTPDCAFVLARAVCVCAGVACENKDCAGDTGAAG